MATGLLVSSDLFFISKITGTGSALSYPIQVTGSLAKLQEGLAAGGVNAIFVDLEQRSIALDQIIQAVVDRQAVRCIAFGAHVNTETLKAARGLGFDAVMPRSQFSVELPKIISHLSGGSGDQSEL